MLPVQSWRTNRGADLLRSEMTGQLRKGEMFNVGGGEQEEEEVVVVEEEAFNLGHLLPELVHISRTI